jgi:galactose-1-phosphate uridylyltransferase
LCAGNLDPEERGVPFGENYAIYCNPFPIVDRHLSVVHREHRLQRIAGETGTVLDLAAVLPGYFVIYNGPECGASAPDHLHFQAGAATFPIFEETERLGDIAVRNYGRNVFRFRDADRSRLVDRLDRTIELLFEVTGKRPEPMLNIAAFHRDTVWTVYVFPRAKHRPGVYHTGELTISPGSIDLCGLVVAPFEKDFAKLTGSDIDSIFREVTLSDSMFEDVASRL